MTWNLPNFVEGQDHGCLKSSCWTMWIKVRQGSTRKLLVFSSFLSYGDWILGLVGEPKDFQEPTWIILLRAWALYPLRRSMEGGNRRCLSLSNLSLVFSVYLMSFMYWYVSYDYVLVSLEEDKMELFLSLRDTKIRKLPYLLLSLIY